MSERYKKIKEYNDLDFNINCPVDIDKQAIYLDIYNENIVFQLKFINIGALNINSVYFTVEFYDEFNNKLDEKDYSILDLDIEPSVYFGSDKLYNVNDNNTRGIKIYIKM